MKNFLISIVLCAFTLTSIAQQAKDTLNKTDKEGRKQGYWKKKDDKGVLKYEGRFVNDQPTDTFKYYYPEGTIKAISLYSANGKKTHTLTYYPNGNKMSIGNYINQKKDSLWKYYNEMGNMVKDEFYNTALAHGEWHTYKPDGSLIDKTTWKYGLKDGPWEQNFSSAFSSGTVKATYKKGKLEGLFQIFNSDGKVRTSGSYKDDLRSGLWMNYRMDNGLPCKKMYYTKDRLVKQEALVIVANKQLSINFDSIAYVYSLGGKAYLRKFSNNTLQINESILDIEDILGTENFIRITKGFIANYSSIKGVMPFENKFLKVQLNPPTDTDVISDEESTKALEAMFKK